MGIAAVYAGGLIERSNLRLDGIYHLLSSGSKRLTIQVRDLLTHNPIRHWVDINADDVTAQPIGFQQRRTTAHKGIADDERAQIVAAEKAICQRLLIGELGQQQGTKKRAWPAREPLVYTDNRAIMLLDLFLSLSQSGHERYVEIFLNHLSQPIKVMARFYALLTITSQSVIGVAMNGHLS